jgi:hypothetical protein
MNNREKEAQDLCEKHLHCANLTIAISSTHNIELAFVACTTGHRIVFKCNRVYLYEGWSFSERNLPEHAWVIEIEGGVDIEVVCLELEWIQA